MQKLVSFILNGTSPLLMINSSAAVNFMTETIDPTRITANDLVDRTDGDPEDTNRPIVITQSFVQIALAHSIAMLDADRRMKLRRAFSTNRLRFKQETFPLYDRSGRLMFDAELFETPASMRTKARGQFTVHPRYAKFDHWKTTIEFIAHDDIDILALDLAIATAGECIGIGHGNALHNNTFGRFQRHERLMARFAEQPLIMNRELRA